VDYVSLHVYYAESAGDTASYLASAVDMDHFIESVVATADAVRARGRHRKSINLSFDEWNVTHPRERGGDDLAEQPPWTFHPRLGESEYGVADAVVVGTMLNSLLRHGDRVTVGCQAQLVNVLGLIRSEEGGAAWKQSIAYPFEQMRRLARGSILQVVATGDEQETARFGSVPVVDATATYDAEKQTAAIFVANRSLTEAARLEVDCRGLSVARLSSASVLRSPEGAAADLTNRVRHDAIVPRPLTGAELDQQNLRADLPPLSWTVFELDRPAS
jgi:alpha-N-arabinofuranosidase